MATGQESGGGVGNFATRADGSTTEGANATRTPATPSPSGDGLASQLDAVRHGDLPAVPFSFTAWVEINGIEYAAVQVAVTQSKVESRAICELAVGTNTRDLAGRKAVPANFLFTRGTPARVLINVENKVSSAGGRSILLQAGTHVLFDGVIDDGGPSNLSHGRFNLRVVIVSKLIYLATGSLQFVGMPSGYLGGGLANLLSNEFPIAIRGDTAAIDFWAAVRLAYTEVITINEGAIGATGDPAQRQGSAANALDAFLQEFGPRRSTANVALLAQITGSLPGGIFSDTSMVDCVTRYFNAEIGYDLAQQSILQRIHGLAEDFHFALVEHGKGYAVVPYTPFVPRSSITHTIWPDTVYSAQWNSRSTASIAGLAFIDNLEGTMLGDDRSDAQGAATFSVYGAYKRPGAPTPTNTLDPQGDALGLLLPMPAPVWLSGKAARQETAVVVGTGLIGASAVEIRRFGDPYARELALKQAYGGRSLVVECPLRMDIGVCSPVKMVYPDVAGTGLQDAAAVYGAVESVTIILDAASKRAVTVLEIMYARSEKQQHQDIDPGPFGGTPGGPTYLHPVWAKAYLGSRLDEHPDPTESRAELIGGTPDLGTGDFTSRLPGNLA